MSKSTITYLKQIMPGQPNAWYERIAGEVLAGRMPLPKIQGVVEPSAPKPPAASKPSATVPNTVGAAIRQASRKQPANAATKAKLHKLAHSDKAVAARLASQVAFNHPHKSEQWCYEKAIFDLERDRH
jgi:hypothetical protein